MNSRDLMDLSASHSTASGLALQKVVSLDLSLRALSIGGIPRLSKFN